MPMRSQASTHSGVGTLCEVRTALQPISLQPRKPERTAAGQAGRPHAGVILVVAGALDLQLLSVEEKALVCIEYGSADTECHPLGIAHLPVGLDGHHRASTDSAQRPTTAQASQAWRLQHRSRHHRLQSDCAAIRRWQLSLRFGIEYLPAHFARSLFACSHSARPLKEPTPPTRRSLSNGPCSPTCPDALRSVLVSHTWR